MSYEVVRKLKCRTNTAKDGINHINLTVGETYKSASSNTSINASSFMVFDDDGFLNSFDKRYFEIIKTESRENTGWVLHCNDCGSEIALKELLENGKVCPKCGQKLDLT